MSYLYAVPSILSATYSPCMQIRASFCIVLGKRGKRLCDAGVKHTLQANLSDNHFVDLITQPFSTTQSVHAVMNHRL